jgi:ribose/xylose/arabinose/galactoside ABC-type transport system permease subunit
MDIAKILITIGLILVFSGIIIYTIPQSVKWIGKLPGDIHFESENYKIYFPIVSMILLSVILTTLFNVAGWILSRFK